MKSRYDQTDVFFYIVFSLFLSAASSSVARTSLAELYDQTWRLYSPKVLYPDRL